MSDLPLLVPPLGVRFPEWISSLEISLSRQDALPASSAACAGAPVHTAFTFDFPGEAAQWHEETVRRRAPKATEAAFSTPPLHLCTSGSVENLPRKVQHAFFHSKLQ